MSKGKSDGTSLPKVDNRIPSVLAKFKKAPQFDGFSYLTFQDWYDRKETESPDWIIVGRKWNSQGSGLATLSAIVKGKNKKVLRTILADSGWEVTSHFMMQFSGSLISGDNEYAGGYPAYHRKVRGATFIPFSILRNFHGYKADTFELVQDFVLFYDAFYAQEKKEYQRIDEDGELHSVARIRYEGDNVVLEIDAHHLRRYLTANDCYLVRYHDHHRYSEADVSQYVAEKPKGYKFASPSAIYEVWIAETSLPSKGKDYKSLSRLLGKDIIYPYERNTVGSVEEDEKFVSFVVGRDGNGKPVEATCNERELSNYFSDAGTPHVLTPVYFKPEVLTRYSQEPSRFTVTDGELYCLDLWSIPIDRTDEDLIQVWLYHLGQIPYQEQLYWRKFNVFPRGTITKHRFERDFAARFADPVNNPLFDFRQVRDKIQEQTEVKYGEALFKELDASDRYTLSSLHLPFTDEQVEFDQQVQFLAKVLNDSLNVSLLTRETGISIDPNSDVKGSLDLLAKYLGHLGMSTNEIQNTISAFHAVQTLRSTGTAHRKGEKFEKALQRYNLVNLTNRDRFTKMITNATTSLKNISAII